MFLGYLIFTFPVVAVISLICMGEKEDVSCR